MGETAAILKLDYIEAQDSASAFTSPEVTLTYPIQAIGYQFVWGASVVGQFVFEATIFDDEWESLVSCTDPVVVTVAGGTAASEIVVIPHLWLMLSKLRFRWVPDAGGSTGNVNVALRVVPL